MKIIISKIIKIYYYQAIFIYVLSTNNFILINFILHYIILAIIVGNPY